MGNNRRRWTGRDGFQAARQADEHTGWMAGRWSWDKENTEIKHGKNTKGILLSKHSLVPRLASTTLKQRSGYEWLTNRGLSRAEMMTGDWWEVCKSDRCRAGENEETTCPRGMDTATAVAVPSPQLAPPGDPPAISGCSAWKSRTKDASKMLLRGCQLRSSGP